MQKAYLLAISTLALSGLSTLQASIINNSTGVLGVGITPSYVLTFNDAPGLGMNSLITNQFSFAGVTFSAPAYYDGNSAGYGCSGSHQNGDCVSNFASTPVAGLLGAPVVPFSIFFSAPQSSAGFALVTDNIGGNNNTTITALRNGSVVDQGIYTTSINEPNNYYVFYNETTSFDQIRISTTGANLIILDNLQLQSVPPSVSQSTPEPATMGMFSAGLLGVVVAARRRRRSV